MNVLKSREYEHVVRCISLFKFLRRRLDFSRVFERAEKEEFLIRKRNRSAEKQRSETLFCPIFVVRR